MLRVVPPDAGAAEGAGMRGTNGNLGWNMINKVFRNY